MDLCDFLYRNIQLYVCKTGKYPDRLILGIDKCCELEKIMRSRLAIGLTEDLTGGSRKLWGIPITIDHDDRNVIKLGYVEVIELEVVEEVEHGTNGDTK